MSATATIVLIVVIIVVIAAIVYGIQVARRRKLQNTFGPEYDRVVSDAGSRTEAEKELREREKRHAGLELKPLSRESQDRYATAWEEVQIQFVDNPTEAVTTADDLVTRLMAERGYPTENYESMLADLSVEHAGTLQHYRDAHDISRRNTAGEANTEELRQALVHYRALFGELLGTVPTDSESSGDSAPAAESVPRTAPAPRTPADDEAQAPDTRR
ncbi:hypothetical protein HH310_30705 [Actinoplanes sp. TBRC 11911]|uniref:hypothetical protein n=1 Tax=Actinoplanes sp. TBRC 11911 TaxID=2729386 RepID=UPI00145EB815|nr:hypothetical protein [Actinoplanes sp. TBRC 11911]NMO55543.1 hypothetical protein [Actinoplanes sp. TBRC 11911]